MGIRTMASVSTIGKLTRMWALVGEFMKRYGQVAFGVIAVLILYTLMFRPIAEDKQASLERFVEIATALDRTTYSLESLMTSQARIADSQAITAKVLERTVDRLEHLADTYSGIDRRQKGISQ